MTLDRHRCEQFEPRFDVGIEQVAAASQASERREHLGVEVGGRVPDGVS